eukprot:TRINITY_DN3067_c1_g1_i2.p1 TRINITY_DN3067_c1_g1~~TRINITY_DN3067_c1_g1_i2.p1  ORF type:complete len:792 (+),score=148.73 TRINITY_DN3067_c1_g1_i2:158-2533(+)
MASIPFEDPFSCESGESSADLGSSDDGRVFEGGAVSEEKDGSVAFAETIVTISRPVSDDSSDGRKKREPHHGRVAAAPPSPRRKISRKRSPSRDLAATVSSALSPNATASTAPSLLSHSPPSNSDTSSRSRSPSSSTEGPPADSPARLRRGDSTLTDLVVEEEETDDRIIHIICAASLPRVIYLLTHPHQPVDCKFRSMFLSIYPYVSSTKFEPGLVIIDLLRKRWDNVAIGVKEDKVDVRFRGLVNGSNQAHIIDFLFEWLQTHTWEFGISRALCVAAEKFARESIMPVHGKKGLELLELLKVFLKAFPKAPSSQSLIHMAKADRPPLQRTTLRDNLVSSSYVLGDSVTTTAPAPTVGSAKAKFTRTRSRSFGSTRPARLETAPSSSRKPPLLTRTTRSIDLAAPQRPVAPPPSLLPIVEENQSRSTRAERRASPKRKKGRSTSIDLRKSSDSKIKQLKLRRRGTSPAYESSDEEDSSNDGSMSPRGSSNSKSKEKPPKTSRLTLNISAITPESGRAAPKTSRSPRKKRMSRSTIKAKEQNPQLFHLRNQHLPDNINILDISAIPTDELFYTNWKRKEKRELSAGVVTLIDWFNRMTDWIVTEIVSQLTVKRRAKMLKKFISVGEWCVVHHNLNTAMEIVSALCKSPVIRLKFTWAELSESLLKKNKLLKDLLDPVSNYSKLRELQDRKETSFCLPYIGIILQDLLNIEEIEARTPEGLFNFRKLRRLSAYFHRVLVRQKASLPFDIGKDTMSLSEYLQADSLIVLADDVQYKFSYLAEARDAIKKAGLK